MRSPRVLGEEEKRTRDRNCVLTKGEESMEKAKEKVLAQEGMRFKKEGLFTKSREAKC